MSDTNTAEPTKLFPEYLNIGSSGRAVLMLKVWLKGVLWGIAPGHVSGDLFYSFLEENLPLYDKEMAAAVRFIQEYINTKTTYTAGKDAPPPLEVDGHFGPATRAAVYQIFGVDFNEIPALNETHAVQPDGSTQVITYPRKD